MYQNNRDRGDNMAAYRPDNALRRARDFELAGDKRLALDHLFETLRVTGKSKQKMWLPAHEQMMLKFVELCVEHRATRQCKEGLMSYRYLQAGAGVEHPMIKVVVTLIETCTRKAAEARARMESSTSTLDAVDDLDEGQSPEALLMGSFTSEGSRERAERETLLPWLRFMLDTYRNVLEVLQYLPILEHLYHSVAIKAMLFCRTYNRGGEFRKIATILKKHKNGFLENYARLVEGVKEERTRHLTPESVERHMGTRFYALETCAELGLWSQGFGIVEDIHSLMERTQVLPKVHLMATYYEKLARIFFVSENYLYHAYAWWRFYYYSAAQPKLTEEDKRTLATAVVLAALAIPTSSGSGTAPQVTPTSVTSPLDAILDPGTQPGERERKDFLSRLLRWTSSVAPSREALLAELSSKGVLRAIRPEAASLVRLLEGDFDPLHLPARAQPLLHWLSTHTGPTLPAHIGIVGLASAKAHNLAQYLPNIERLLVFRLLEQLTSVYTVMRLDHFRSLISSLRLQFFEVEKFIMRAVRARQLALRIDHRSQVIHLGSEAMEAAAVRKQLSELSARLTLLVEAVQPKGGKWEALPTAPGVSQERREAFFIGARRVADFTPRTYDNRKTIIQEYKERITREATRRMKMDEERAKEEKLMLAQRQEEVMRDEEKRRLAASIKSIDEQEKAKKVTSFVEKNSHLLSLDISKLEQAARAALDLSKLEQEAREKAQKAMVEENRRKVEQARKMDYLCRALREGERAKLDTLLASLNAEHTAFVVESNKVAEALHAKHVRDAAELSAKLPVIRPHLKAFVKDVLGKRKADYLANKDEAERTARHLFYNSKLNSARDRKKKEEKAEEERRQKKREEEKEKAEREKLSKLEARFQGDARDAEMMNTRSERSEETSNWRSNAMGPLSAQTSGGMVVGGGGGMRTAPWRPTFLKKGP